jgi:hypothetical protein
VDMKTTYEQLSDEIKGELNIMMDEIPRIKEYANECLNDVAVTYGTVRKGFDNELNWS